MKKETRVHTLLKPCIISPEAYALILPSIRLLRIFFYKQLDEKGHWGAHSFETPNNRPQGTRLGLTEYSSSTQK